MTITTDELWPRTPLFRYRLYAVPDTTMEILAAAPTMGGIGIAINELHEDEKQAGQRLADRGRIGVLDVCPGGKIHDTGEWIVLPFDRHDPRYLTCKETTT